MLLVAMHLYIYQLFSGKLPRWRNVMCYLSYAPWGGLEAFLRAVSDLDKFFYFLGENRKIIFWRASMYRWRKLIYIT